MDGFSIVIPIYNEEGNIDKLLNEIDNQKDLKFIYEFICVNDASSDKSLEVIKQLKLKTKITFFSHQDNLGQSRALLTGIENSNYNNIITIDGDGQNDPKDINKLLEEYIKSNVCLVSGIRENRKDSYLKIISSIIANKFRSYILKDGCKDIGCGLKIFKKNIFLSFPYFNGIHRFLPSLFIGFGYKVKYMPVSHRPRLSGTSKYGTIDRLFKGIRDIIKVKTIINSNKLNV